MATPLIAMAANSKTGRKIIGGSIGMLAMIIFLPLMVIMTILTGLAGASTVKANTCSASIQPNDPMFVSGAAVDAGFKGPALLTAVEISFSVNSGHDASADSNGGIGLWAIPKNTTVMIDVSGTKVPPVLKDPTDNAKVAFTLSKKGTDFSFWKDFNNSNYKQFESDAQVAIDNLQNVNAGCCATSGVAGNDGTPSIMGTEALNAAEILHWWNSQGHRAAIATPISTIIGYYIDDGERFGVTGDIAFAQAIEETGFFTNSDSVNLNNFAGMAHCDSCGSGSGFPTAADGVREQISLLKQVTQGSSQSAGGVRYGLRQTSTWGGLSGNWATDTHYAEQIMTIYNSIRADAGVGTSGGGTECGSTSGSATTQGIEEAANQLAAMHLPYVYGGGHGSPPGTPSGSASATTGQPGKAGLDCSGATVWVLNHAGFHLPSMVSGDFMVWGDPVPDGSKLNPNAAYVVANAEHVYMWFPGHNPSFFESNTSASATGGPGWRPGKTIGGEQAGFGERFVIRHVPGT